MAENSKIQWTTHTFNPWRGCTKVAAGCANCYADRQSKRNPKTLGIWGPDGTRVVASEATWREPIKWDKKAACCCRKEMADHQHEAGCPQRNRPRVFCASLADVFEDWPGEVVDHLGCSHYTKDGDPTVVVTGEQMRGTDSDGYHYTTLDDCRGRLFRLIDLTPNLDWLLLTKRPQNIRRMWPEYELGRWDGVGRVRPLNHRRPNVWLGTSIACQEDADRNIPKLLACRDLAPVLFLSIEPLIGPVRLSLEPHPGMATLSEINSWEQKRIDWVICGGESGPKARECHIDWIRSIVRQCREADVPCFVKQLGAFPIDSGADGVDEADVRAMPDFYRLASVTDPKGGDPDEWPADLRVRQFPVVMP